MTSALLRGMRMGAPGVAPPPPGNRVGILNMNTLSQETGYFPLANIWKSRFNDMNGTGAFTTDSDGDMATLAVGAEMYGSAWGPLTNGIHYIKTGSYVIKWSGSDLPLSVVCTGSSSLTKTGTRRWTVTLAQVSSSNSLSC